MREVMPSLLSYFIRRMEDPEDAADALSETLLVLWRKHTVVPERSEEFRMYAFGVARKVLANAYRGRLKRRQLAERLRTEIREFAEVAAPADAALREALDKLSKTDRDLVLLVAWDGFGVAEAGALLRLRPSTARARYSRARARLRSML
jgi:RNA polymerase sigma-70 factor (ECF subfamily)